MALWKENKVNPAGGCLPLLLQFPFFIAFFNVINNYAYAGSLSFLWIPDITSPDRLFIMPILAAATTYLQMKATTSSADATQKNMALMMPAMIGIMSLRFAAGLTIYWVANNVFTLAQQLLTPNPDRKGAAEK
jgi:YidC/Oxa1 family membrane protein insertase